MKRDIYREVTDRIISELEKGTVPWTKPWVDIHQVSYNGTKYRGINLLMLTVEQALNEYRTGTWYTFKMAKAAGGYVRKGEKGTPVLFFRRVTKEDEDGEEEKSYWVSRQYYVWNRDQIEGLKDDIPPPVEVSGEDWKQVSDLIAASSEAVIRMGGNRAYYSPSEDHIQLPYPEQFDHSGHFHSTRFHELVHWTGSEKRLDRDMCGKFGDEDYAREELIAEIGSAFLCNIAGLEANLQHPEYIAEWLKVLKNDEKAVAKAASHAQKAVDYLLQKAAID